MNVITNNYKNIRVSIQRGIFTLQIYRPESQNSINNFLLEEIMTALREIEFFSEIKVVILQGLPDIFCSGM